MQQIAFAAGGAEGVYIGPLTPQLHLGARIGGEGRTGEGRKGKKRINRKGRKRDKIRGSEERIRKEREGK